MTFGKLIEPENSAQSVATNQAQESLREVEEHLEDTPSMRN